MMKPKTHALCAVALLLATAQAHALSYIGELRTPYVFRLSIDAKSSTDPEVKPYLDKATKLLGSNFKVADYDEVLSVRKDGTFQLQSAIPMGWAISSVTPLDKLIRTSSGKVNGGRPVTARFEERRGSGEPPFVAQPNGQQNKLLFYRGSQTVRTETLPAGGVTDLLMLGYMFLGDAVPVKNVSISAVDSKRPFFNMVLKATETPITFGGQTFQTVKFTRVLPPGEDAILEFWVRKADGMPVRTLIGLSGKYGATLDFYPSTLPALLTTHK